MDATPIIDIEPNEMVSNFIGALFYCDTIKMFGSVNYFVY